MNLRYARVVLLLLILIPFPGCDNDPYCPEGMSWCWAKCVDLMTDEKNCGSCDYDCLPGGHCSRGVCVYEGCTTNDQCPEGHCCIGAVCVLMDCRDTDCGPDPVCGFECGPCTQGTECDRGTCVTGPICNPPCPEGSECIELDSYGEPECVWPAGWLACADDTHCPIGDMCDGNGFCHSTCVGCMGDEDCADMPGFCFYTSFGCGTCMPFEPFLCNSDSDCVVAARIDVCCPYPNAWNVQTVQDTPCFEEYPYNGQVPDTCEPNCTGLNHCWPIVEDPTAAICIGGICVLE